MLSLCFYLCVYLAISSSLVGNMYVAQWSSLPLRCQKHQCTWASIKPGCMSISLASSGLDICIGLPFVVSPSSVAIRELRSCLSHVTQYTCRKSHLKSQSRSLCHRWQLGRRRYASIGWNVQVLCWRERPPAPLTLLAAFDPDLPNR